MEAPDAAARRASRTQARGEALRPAGPSFSATIRGGLRFQAGAASLDPVLKGGARAQTRGQKLRPIAVAASLSSGRKRSRKSSREARLIIALMFMEATTSPLLERIGTASDRRPS